MQSANTGWGAPRIHGELLKLGIAVSQATVSKYMARHRKPPSQTWRTFLENHVADLVSVDFFTVPTATCCCRRKNAAICRGLARCRWMLHAPPGRAVVGVTGARVCG
jgi:hypothetical protein